MTGPVKKMSISVPQDVAETLAEQPNASAYVTAAVRHRRRVDGMRDLLGRAGIQVTEEGVAAARARRLALEAEWTPERWAALRERVSHAIESDPDGWQARQEPAA
jgi:hypothetical protein